MGLIHGTLSNCDINFFNSLSACIAWNLSITSKCCKCPCIFQPTNSNYRRNLTRKRNYSDLDNDAFGTCLLSDFMKFIRNARFNKTNVFERYMLGLLGFACANELWFHISPSQCYSHVQVFENIHVYVHLIYVLAMFILKLYKYQPGFFWLHFQISKIRSNSLSKM